MRLKLQVGLAANQRVPRVNGYLLAKRVMDVAVSAIALVVASPFVLAAAVAIRATMGAPVIFRQERSGLGGAPFDVLKFRTMRHAPGDWDPKSDAQRLTRVGSFLRRWSLDELPQLVNVLRGEMSLVGPRPLPVRYLPRYNSHQRRRLEALPGITGWAQVNGRNATTWPNRFTYDEWYVDHRSFALDLRILGLTVRNVIAGAGVRQDGEATMTEFMGE